MPATLAQYDRQRAGHFGAVDHLDVEDREALVQHPVSLHELGSGQQLTSRLLDSATRAELRTPTNGTRWTNKQLLFHMLFGFVVVRVLLPLVKGFGRLPPAVSRVFAAILKAGTRPFHVLNYLSALPGGTVLDSPAMGILMYSTDAALAVLPDLIAGKAVDIDGTTVQIAPAAERLAELAADLGRPVPTITGSVSVAIDGDPALPDRDGLVRKVSDPDGIYGMPTDAVPDILVTGGPAAGAERISALLAVGAERVVVTLAAGHWSRQAELLAEATALLN